MSLATLVLAAPYYVFYTTRHWIYCRLDKNGMVFAITLIWYHKHRQTHTWHAGTNIITLIKYIYTDTTCYMRTTTPCIALNNFPTQNLLYRGSQCLYCLNIIHLEKTKSFLSITKNTDRNGINGQNTPREKKF